MDPFFAFLYIVFVFALGYWFGYDAGRDREYFRFTKRRKSL